MPSGTETPFGQWLKAHRKALDLTQEALGEQIGCSEATVQKIELGERRPSRQIAELLAEYFHVPRDERAAFIYFARFALPPITTQPIQDEDAIDDVELIGDAVAPWRGQWRHHTNLPVPPTQLIGRDREMAELGQYLLSNRGRLATLTGPPGIGKTRLTLEVASKEELASHFSDGIFFVELAPISDHHLVAITICKALGIKASASKPPLEDLKEYLCDKRLLLVLDNFEQVVVAAPQVAQLLAASPWLKVLITSRQALHLRGERHFLVPPLGLPDFPRPLPLEDYLSYPAVALFVERAQDAHLDFTLTVENAEVIAGICAHLDGLPLAIELVAARTNFLSPQALLGRLTSPTTRKGEAGQALLASSLRDLPPRQQTLDDAIGWSYDLLDEGEKALFRRLGVFVGGCKLAAAEATCNAYGHQTISVSDGLASLVDKSMLQVRQRPGTDREPRYIMLDTIREFALERLREDESIKHDSSKDEVVERTKLLHAEYFSALADEALSHMMGPQQQAWLDKLEEEHDNFRAALSWSLGSQEGKGETARPDVEIALRLAGALWRFWFMHGHLSEGRKWLQAALSLPVPPTPASTQYRLARMKAVGAAGALATHQGDRADAELLFREQLELARELGDKPSIANSLNNLGVTARLQGDLTEARRLHEESLALIREAGDDRTRIAGALHNLGTLAYDQGDLEAADRFYSESLELFRESGYKQGMSGALNMLGKTAIGRQEYTLARELLEESLTLARELGSKENMAYALIYLGLSAQEEGDSALAQSCYEQSLELLRELGQKPWVPECLEGLARIAGESGQPERAVRLYAAADALRELIGSPMPILDRARNERDIGLVKKMLDNQAWEAAWNEGRAMQLDEAMDLALKDERIVLAEPGALARRRLASG